MVRGARVGCEAQASDQLLHVATAPHLDIRSAGCLGRAGSLCETGGRTKSMMMEFLVPQLTQQCRLHCSRVQVIGTDRLGRRGEVGGFHDTLGAADSVLVEVTKWGVTLPNHRDASIEPPAAATRHTFAHSTNYLWRARAPNSTTAHTLHRLLHHHTPASVHQTHSSSCQLLSPRRNKCVPLGCSYCAALAAISRPHREQLALHPSAQHTPASCGRRPASQRSRCWRVCLQPLCQ